MIGSAKEGNDLYYLDIEERGKVRAYQIKETIEGFFWKLLVDAWEIRTSKFHLLKTVVS